MAYRYKRRYNGGDYSFERVATAIAGLYAFYLASLWYSDKSKFYQYFILNILILVVVVAGVYMLRNMQDIRKRMRENGILSSVKQEGLEDEVLNFINRFGMGKKDKNHWTFEAHSFEWHQMEIFRKMLNEKGLNLSLDKWDDTLFILKYYIQQKEERIVRGSVSIAPKTFNSLSGSEFEDLLYRLFEKMGYIVQKTGKTGDQGYDLIANIDNTQRIIIQAKCYSDSPVGNEAVQEAVAAQKYYDCNGAMVVTSSNFTNGAIELAKANSVMLVDKKRLSELLLQYLNESWG